jgi:hypothetical protein
MKVSSQLQLPIRPGMREDIDARAGVEPGTLLYAQNVRFRQKGAAVRRSGTTELATTMHSSATTTIAAQAQPDFVAGDIEKVIAAGGYAFRRNDTTGEWSVAGLTGSAMPVRRVVTMFHRPGASHPALAGAATVAIDSAGYMLVAYCVNDTVGSSPFGPVCGYRYYAPDGTAVISGFEFSSTVRCRAVAVGATIYLVLQDSAATNAVLEAYAFTAGAQTGPTTLVTLDAQADSWDVAPWPGATAGRWLLTWYDSSSTTVTVRRLNALATEADATFTPAGAPRIACYANTNHVWVGTVDDTSQAAIARCYVFSAGSLTLAAGPTNAWTFTAANEASSPPIFGTGTSVTSANYVGWILSDTSANADSGCYQYKSGSYTTAGTNTVGTAYGGYPTSPPFGPVGEYSWVDSLANLNTAAVAGSTSPAPRRPVMLRRTSSSGVGIFQVPELTAKRSATYINDTTRVDRWTRPAQRPNGNWVMPLAVWIPDDSTGSIYYEFLEFEAPCTTTRAITSAAGTLVAPGQPVDLLPRGGTEGGVVEVGFITAPTITLIDVGSGTLADGQYFVAACYRWIDDIGRERRSAPSPVARLTISGGGGAAGIDITVTTQTWFRSRRAGGSGFGQLEIYVSSTDESALYLLNDDYPAAAGSAFGSGVIQYTDLTFDPATITANRELYTDGGVQQNDMPPSGRCVVASEETLWVGVTWDRTLWQESKPIFPEEPANFSDNDAFKVRFPEDTVAGGYMDGTLIVGSERALYAVRGQGPDDRGSGSPRTPYQIVSGLGMVNERAVQVTPLGLFFESHRGIELLPRGLGPPVFIGEAVQNQLALRPSILDSTFHVGDDASTVRFLVEDPEALDEAFDAATGVQVTSTAGASGNSVVATLNHVLGGDADRLVIAFVGLDLRSGFTYSPGTAGVTLNGVAMTALTEYNISNQLGLLAFYMLESALPAAGTYAVTATVPTSGAPSGTTSGISLGVISRENAAQEAPTVLAAVTGDSAGLGVMDISQAVTAEAYQTLVDCVYTASSNGNRSPDAGQTERVDLAGSSQSIGVSDKAGTAAGGATTMGWDFTSSQTNFPYMILGVSWAAENVGTRELVYDIDAQAWSVDTKPVAVAALGTTPDGLLFASASLGVSPALLLEDASATTDDGVFFEGRLTFHNCYPAGFTGQTKFQACAARTTLDANPSGVNVKVTLDDDTTRSKTITKIGTDTSKVKLYQCDPGNFDNRCGSVTVELFDSAGGVTWYGATIYHEAEPEMTYPTAPAERG